MKTFDMLVLMRVLYRQGLPVWAAMEPEELARVDAAAEDIVSGKPAPEPEPKKRRRKPPPPTALEKERTRVSWLYIRGHISEEELDRRVDELDRQIKAESEEKASEKNDDNSGAPKDRVQAGVSG